MANRFVEAIRLILETARREGFRTGLIGGFALPFHGVRRYTEDVDFLVEDAGAEAVHRSLLSAGERCLHRTAELANYDSSSPSIAPVDLLFARRAPTQAMLARASQHPIASAGLTVPVVDAEGIIGLKVQAIANNPSRTDRDRDDIKELLVATGGRIDMPLVRSYFQTFEMEDLLDRLLIEIRAS